MLSSRFILQLKRFLLLFVGLVFIFQIFAVHTIALSDEQKRLYRLNINYYDLAACGELAEAESESDAAVDGSVQEMAQQMLDNGKISYWTNNGVNTKDIVVAMSKGKKAYTTSAEAGQKEVDINPNILKFILEAAKEGKVMVNALTDKDHSSTSNHYKGLAVDLDNGVGNTTVPVDKLIAIARKYDGAKNDESTHHHFDFTKRPAGGEGGPEEGSVGTGVYMVGDSLTVRAKTALEAEFSSRNIDLYINASEGRSISGPGTTNPATSGLKAVADDKNRIKNADTVIVALGTNPENEFGKRIKEMVGDIRSHNKDVNIYWVNVFATDPNVDKKGVNDTIERMSLSENFSVIDTTGHDIELSSDKLHQTVGQGSKQFAKVIATGMESERTVEPTKGNICRCGGEEFDASAALRGAENAEKIFNFLVDKGLTKKQAAGVVGNFSVESGFDPFKQEIGKTPPIGGYGIAQWTGTGAPGDPAGARRLDMIKAMKKKGIEVDLNNQTISKSSGNDKVLSAQLDYMWKEATARGNIEQLKQETTVGGAVRSWLANFEIAGISHEERRIAGGEDAIARFGSGGGGAAEDSPDESSCIVVGEGEGQVVGEYSLPVAKKWYNKNKSWFEKPHHNDSQASDIPVPTGTPVFSMTAGTVIQAPTSGDCGTGVIIDTDEGVRYTYCHGTDGGSVKGAKQGDKVKPGQRIMTSGNTGRSFGAHLHVQISVGGSLRCPQPLFKSIVEGEPKKESTLPTTGCTS